MHRDLEIALLRAQLRWMRDAVDRLEKGRPGGKMPAVVLMLAEAETEEVTARAA